jgi:hypothetical protein
LKQRAKADTCNEDTEHEKATEITSEDDSSVDDDDASSVNALADDNKAFLKIVEDASALIDTASNYQNTAVKQINPNAGQVDCMFAWGITPHCETSHSGMKMTYAAMGEAFQMFKRTRMGGFTQYRTQTSGRLIFVLMLFLPVIFEC